jgi:hypothetical protein
MGLTAVVAGRNGVACADPPPPFPMLLTTLTVLTVLTVFSSVLRILIILFPARPSRLNVISMPNARGNVCIRRWGSERAVRDRPRGRTLRICAVAPAVDTVYSGGLIDDPRVHHAGGIAICALL